MTTAKADTKRKNLFDSRHDLLKKEKQARRFLFLDEYEDEDVLAM